MVDIDHLQISRRGIVRGAAWATPVVWTATALPAMAASQDPFTGQGVLWVSDIYFDEGTCSICRADVHVGNNQKAGTHVRLDAYVGEPSLGVKDFGPGLIDAPKDGEFGTLVEMCPDVYIPGDGSVQYPLEGGANNTPVYSPGSLERGQYSFTVIMSWVDAFGAVRYLRWTQTCTVWAACTA